MFSHEASLQTNAIIAVDLWTSTFSFMGEPGVLITVVFGYIMLMHSSLAAVQTSLMRVNQAESPLGFSRLVRFVCFRARACMWAPVIGTRSSPPPATNPPVSVAVKRNGWYFRGEFLFPFLASIFYLTMWASASSIVDPDCSNDKFRPSYGSHSGYVFKHHGVAE